MKKIIIAFAVLAVAGIGTYYIVFRKSSGGNPVNNPPENSAASNITVNIKNFSFNPFALNINQGDTVVWTNQDSVPHQLVSVSSAFSSGFLSNGQSFSFTFSQSGTYSYHCAIHPSMKGEIVVK